MPLFWHDAARAQTHRADDIAIIFHRSENDGSSRQGIEIDFFENAEAVLLRHAQVERSGRQNELRSKTKS